MRFVIKVGEDEDLPEAPPDWPRCGSWPPSNGFSATMQSSNSDVSLSNLSVSNLSVILALLLVIVSTALIMSSIYIVRIKRDINNDSPERTHLLNDNQTYTTYLNAASL